MNDFMTITEATFGTSSTTEAPPDTDLKVLAWLIPLVVAAIAVLFALAVGLFYCIVKTELAFIKRCPCCCRGGKDGDEEYVPLHEHTNSNRYTRSEGYTRRHDHTHSGRYSLNT